MLYIPLMYPDDKEEFDGSEFEDNAEDSFDPAEEARWAWDAAHHGEFDDI